MMGVLLQVRTFLMMSTPSMSGRPRSSRITSGRQEAASSTPEAPFLARRYW